MIIDYDHNPALTTDQKLQSLKESVQMALNEIEANNSPEQKSNNAKEIIESYTGSTLAGIAQSVKSAIDAVASRFASYVSKSGDTMTGDLTISTSDSTSRVRVTTSATNIVLAAQNGGHHGLWSATCSKWLLYGLTDGTVKANETIIPASATLLTDSASSVTATKVDNYYSGTGITAMKNGGCVTVHVAFTASATFSGRTTIATIPAGYRPMTQVFGYRNGSTEYFIVESNGDVKFNSLASGSTYYGVATYCKA